MSEKAKQAFASTALGAQNRAYDLIADMDPEYFDKLKGIYVDATFGRDGALPRKTKELIMVAITCALSRPRGVRLHAERALASGATPREVLEAVEVAAIPGGMPGLWLGVETLHDILNEKGIEFK
ncbi:MAG TPA: carboxymuconolactone decarboxylase family protein [Candidatus Binatia bacterium]|nr:carboxymuconolactone decarboxylase family protein [Candidatus Binatia bacterium]